MYMFCNKLGELEVEIEVNSQDPRLSEIRYGYDMETFRELSEEDIDYLNETYRDEIVTQALEALVTGTRDSVGLRQ